MVTTDLRWYDGRLSFHLVWFVLGLSGLWLALYGFFNGGTLWEMVKAATLPLVIMWYALTAHLRVTYPYRLRRYYLKRKAPQ
jgi:hypothetical protein